MNEPVDTPMADVNLWGWQGSYKNIKDRTTYMLDHSPIPFNVKFKVGHSGKNVDIIEAHKDVLAKGSEVFRAMFHGDSANKNKIIEIPDIDPRAFRVMIRFLYTEELTIASLDEEAVVAFEAMRCAGKYGIPYLYIHCRQWIMEHFDELLCDEEDVQPNALSYLQLALKAEYADQKIIEAIWSLIDRHAEMVLQTPDEVLRDVSLDLLTEFLARNSLTILKEKNVYDFAVRWAKLQSSVSDSDTAESSLRERLGDAIKYIRYPQMEMSEFANGPVSDKVVTSDEAVQVYQYHFASAAEPEFLLNSSRPRKGTSRPTTLEVDATFYRDGASHPALTEICSYKEIVGLAVQLTDLRPELMRLVEKLGCPDSNGIRTATWSFDGDSFLSTLTVRFGKDFIPSTNVDCNVYLEEEQRQLLSEGVGQMVKLGFGDVAMEVAYNSEFEHNRLLNKKGYRLNALSLIFGAYASSTYVSAAECNSVFYLGCIMAGTIDFSFLRHFVEAGQLFPTKESFSCYQHPEKGDDENE